MEKLTYKDFFDFDDDKPLSEAITNIEKLENVYKHLSQEVKKSAKKMADELKDVNVAFEGGQKEIMKTYDVTNAMLVENKKLKDSQDALAKSKKQLTNAVKAETGSMEDLRGKLKDAEKNYKALGDSADEAIKEKHLKDIAQLSKEFNKANNALKTAKKEAEAAAGSYNALNKQVLEGRKRLKSMGDGMKGNSEEFKNLQKELSENIAKLKEWDEAIGDNFRDVGRYDKALEGITGKMELIPGATSSAAGGVQAFGQQLKMLLANPIVLVIAAIVGGLTLLGAAFKKTAFAGDLFAKMGGYVSGIMSGVVKIADKVRIGVMAAFENPKQALIDLGNGIKNNIINRFLGIIELGKATALVLQGIWDRDLEKIKKGSLEAGQALIQMSTGFDKLQQSKIGDFVKDVQDMGNAFAELAEKQRELIRINRTREVQAARLQKLHEEQVAVGEDDTRAWGERQVAAEKAMITLERLGKVQLQIAQDNLNIINTEVQMRRKNGEDVEEILDRQKEAKLALIEAEKTLSMTELDNAEKRNKLLRDLYEKDLDILIDGFDNQKAVNERILADEKKTIEVRRALFEETKRLGQTALDEEIKVLQRTTKEKIDINDLIATSDAKVLHEKIRGLELTEIMEGRLLEVIRENRTYEQDYAEIKKTLDEAEALRMQNRIAAELEYGDIVGKRKVLENEITDEILKQTKLFAQSDRVALMRENIDLEKDMLTSRYQEEMRLAEQTITDEEERGKRKKILRAELHDAITALDRQAAEERKEILRQEFEKVVGLYQQGTQATMDVLNSRWEREDMRREEQMTKLEQQMNQEIELAGDNEARKEEIYAAFNEKQKQMEAEQAQANRRRAIFEKAMAATQVGIDTARAVMKAVAVSPLTGGLPFSAIVGGIGAIQLAAVLSKPIPAYAEGTDNAPGGLAVINELGREIIEDRLGNRHIIGTDGPTLTHLERGSKVYTHEESKKMLGGKDFDSAMKVYEGGAKRINAGALNDDINRVMVGKLDRLNDTVRNKREVHINITKKGIDLLAKENNTWTKYVDNNYA